MLAPHHQILPPSIAEALVASSNVCVAKLEGGAAVDMSRHRCSAASRAKPRKHGTDFGAITLYSPGVAAAAAGSSHEGADLYGSVFFCRPARRNGGARGGAVPRRAAAPTLFASGAGARVDDTHICRHAARAARLQAQIFTPRVDAGRGSGAHGASAAARRDRAEAGARAAGRSRFGGGAPAVRAKTRTTAFSAQPSPPWAAGPRDGRVRPGVRSCGVEASRARPTRAGRGSSELGTKSSVDQCAGIGPP